MVLSSHAMDHAADAIARHILFRIEPGIIVGDDVLEFARSCLGVESDEVLLRLISDSDLYGDGLVDLVYVPDRTLAYDVETLIPPRGLPDMTVAEIIRIVGSSISPPDFIINGTRYRTEETVNPLIWKKFIQRMKLSVEVPIGGIPIIGNHGTDRRHIESRIIVRHARHTRTEHRDRELRWAYTSLFPDDSICDDLLHQGIEFIVDLFSECGTGDTLYDALCRKRRACETLMDRMDRYAALAARYGCEYMQSMRITPPAADRELLIRSHHVTDMLLVALYGKDWNSCAKSSASVPGDDGAVQLFDGAD